MKTNDIFNTKILWALSFLMLFSACDDFLDKVPQGRQSPDTFFTSEENVERAVFATYNTLLRWELSAFPFLGCNSIISDDADKGSTASDGATQKEMDDFTFTTSNPEIFGWWSGNYFGINRANQVLSNIDAVAMDDAIKNRFKGEMWFLRGFFHFNLVKSFGDVPIRISIPDDSEFAVPKNDAEEVYAQVIDDLEKAIDNLPLRSELSPEDLGRVTKGAAQGMLGKVYLYRQEYAKALTLFEAVINSGEYELFNDYAALFTPAGHGSKEVLFEMFATATAEGGVGSQYNQVQGVRGDLNRGWGFNIPSAALDDAYEMGDPREEATFLRAGETTRDGFTVPDVDGIKAYNQKAYRAESEIVNSVDNGGGHLYHLRYADILLMAAECANDAGNSGDALKYLNMVRARARGGDATLLPDVTDTDKAGLREKIWQERQVEFGMEGIRYFDLIRMDQVVPGYAKQKMDLHGKTNFDPQKHKILPIPQVDIDRTNGVLEQSENY